MQLINDNPDDHRTQNAGIDRLNAEDVLDVIGFQHQRIGGGQNAGGGQIEVGGQVQHRKTDKARERGDTFVFTRHAQRNGDGKHHRQEAEGE
ncbi:hypothetical protein D3C71_1605750 [compost metagenome]